MGDGVEIFRAAAKATVAETKKAFVDLAKKEHARVMATDPKPQRFIRTVDGVVGQREEAVKVNGRIEYYYPRLDEIAQTAMALLYELSPVLSGEYRRSHKMFVNGASVANLSAWDGSGELVISNMLPFARKIEAGKMKMRVPGSDHVYEQAQFLLRQKFGNQASIKFIYRSFIPGLAPGRSQARSSSRFPALIIGAR